MATMLPTQKSQPSVSIEDYVIWLYGRPKVGKTTFASDFKDALFLLTMPAPEALSMYKVNIDSWDTFLKAAGEIAKGEHEYRTIVIDTVDTLFQYCRHSVLSRAGLEHETDEDYGKGWDRVQSEFEKKMAKLCSLGYGIVFISHAQMKQVEGEDGLERTLWAPAMNKTGTRVIRKLASFILFADVLERDDQKWHVLRTRPSVKYEAGVRTPDGKYMKDPVPLSYPHFIREFTKLFQEEDDDE